MYALDRNRPAESFGLPFGIEVTCRPLDATLLERAIQASRLRLGEEMDAGLLPEGDRAARTARGQVLLWAELARLGITAWKGVGLPDRGGPAPCTPEAAAALMEQDWLIGSRFYARYTRDERERAAEGEASAAAPSGTGAAAPDTADPAAPKAPPAPTAAPGTEALPPDKGMPDKGMPETETPKTPRKRPPGARKGKRG